MSTNGKKIAETVAGLSQNILLDLRATPLDGLVCAFCFHRDGTSEELNVEQPIVHGEGWYWLHFNLADARAYQFLNASFVPGPVKRVLLSADEHQQLHGGDGCLYGVIADLVCGLSGITEEIGFLHFVLNESVFISCRRHQLNAVQETRRALN